MKIMRATVVFEYEVDPNNYVQPGQTVEDVTDLQMAAIDFDHSSDFLPDRLFNGDYASIEFKVIENETR